MSNKNSLKEISWDPMNLRFAGNWLWIIMLGLYWFLWIWISTKFWVDEVDLFWKCHPQHCERENSLYQSYCFTSCLFRKRIPTKKMIWNLNSWSSKEGVFHKWYSGPCWLFEVREARSIITALNFASLVWLCRTLSSAPLPALEVVTSVRSLVIKDSAFP